jgi:hypothetical protein
MPLRIDRVETDVHVAPAVAGASAPPANEGDGPGLAGSDSVLLERLRPIVLRILDQQLEQLRRQG